MRKIWDSEVKLAGRSGYSVLLPAAKEERENIALARGKELDISPKHAVEICHAIRGRRVEPAKNYLQRVVDQKDAVPFRRYNGKVGHRRGKGFGPGRYPQKAAAVILKLLTQAEANAGFLELDSENLRIVHIAASRGAITPGWMSRARGRTTASNHETLNVEVMVQEEMEDEL